MKSGAAFSAIFLIWIVGFILAVYSIYPDIEKSIRVAESIDIKDTAKLIENQEDTNAVSYTPLGIFNLINN